MIPTVRGPVAPDALGVTLAHEHVFVRTADVQANVPGEWDEEERVADAVTKLRALTALGVATIVDPTVIGLGRDIPRIQRINAEVDLNVVVATGVYTYHDVPNWFRYRPPGAMADLFVRELTEGIAGTGVRAAFLKCAVDEEGLNPGVEQVLRAVADAHRRTGAPVMVHTHAGTRTGADVWRLLAGEGVDPHRVVLAHSGDTTDADHLCELAEAGFVLGMDRFGIDTTLGFEERVAVVAELVRRGHAGSMVLAHDAACYIDWLAPGLREHILPRWHYGHLHADVLPALRERGVTDADLTTMLVDNPRRWLAG
jgi:phosphotriesterase-related protein